jgi:hypothetical protein
MNTPILPDGSSFFTGSFPLPADHWLYAKPVEGWDDVRNCSPERPLPILTEQLRPQVVAALRYAIRAATQNGKIEDFDPDALVQSAVVALCGNYGSITVEVNNVRTM